MPIDIGASAGALQGSFSLGGIWAWVASMICPPHVQFGSPVQRAKENDLSFWHIPISIKPRIPGGPSSLSRCHLYLDRYDGDRLVDRIKLMWGDAVFTSTGETASLEPNEVILAPVATRREGNDGNAYITDTRHILGKGNPYPISPDRKKVRFKLRIKSGRREYASKHFYIFRVPIAQSNGHFTCEIEYAGEGSV